MSTGDSAPMRPFNTAPSFAAVVGILLAAQLAVTPVSAKSLREVFGLALQHDSAYQSERSRNRAAQEFVIQAKARLMPEISFDGAVSGTRRQSIDNPSTAVRPNDHFSTGSMTLNVTQPIYRRDLVVQISQASTFTALSDADFAFALHDLIVRVADRYFAVLAADDSLDFARAELEAISQQLTQSRQRFEVGLIAITGVEEARAAHDLAVARVIAAENDSDAAREAIREITGSYINTLTELGGDVPLVIPAPNNIDTWTETALEQNQQLLSTRLEVSRLRDEIRRVEAGHLPTVDLVGTSGYTFNNGLSIGNTKSWDNTVGMRINVPIYRGGLVLSQTREAQHQHQRALEDHERQRRATQRLARNSFRGVLSGISQVKALTQAVRSAESALEAIEAGFEVGTRTSVDVLNAQRELFSARRDFSRSRYDYILNILRLKQAAGTLSPQDLSQIDGWLERT
jgi:outer membrane protein